MSTALSTAIFDRMKQLHQAGDARFNDGDWDLTADAVVEAVEGLIEPSAIRDAISKVVSEYADAGMCDQPQLITAAVTTAALAALRTS